MRLIGLFLAFFAFAPAAQALDLSAMTPDEEAAFGRAVREYLLSHPDVLLEVIDKIEADRRAARLEADVAAVAANADALFNNPNDFVGGNPEGDIVLVEFLDYKCGYCKQAFPEVNALLKQDGNIRFVVKEFPILGPQSELAARFALSVKAVAGDKVYGEMHDRMMTFRGDFTDVTLRRLAEDAGLDADAVMAGMADPAIDAVLTANHALAQTLSIDGTPGFILEDQVLRGYVPLEAMTEFVKRARS